MVSYYHPWNACQFLCPVPDGALEVGFANKQGYVCLESKHWSPGVLAVPLTDQLGALSLDRGTHGSEAMVSLSITLTYTVWL